MTFDEKRMCINFDRIIQHERQEIEDRLNRISSPEEIDEILDELRLDGIMLADDSDAHGAKSYQEISVDDFYGEIQGS